MKKIIIVGGGISGLSAGIYGRLAGFDVDIYEKSRVAGGECMGWNRNGYYIDNCIHWLTGTKEGTALRKVWEDIGALSPNMEFAETEAFYTSCVDNQRATLWMDLERTESELLKLSPQDEAEIKKFIEHVKYAQECEIPAEKPMDMMGIGDYISMGKSMADMPKVIKEYGKIDLQDLSARFHSPVLKKLFSDYLPKEYIASSFLVSYATMTSGNGAIPLGGSLDMVNRIVRRFRELGGNLFCSSPVKRILINKREAYGIELQGGEKVTADYVISAVDTKVMFESLIGNRYMTRKWHEVYHETQRYPLISGFQAAFAVNSDLYHDKGTIFFDCKPFMIGNQKNERMSVKSFEYDRSFAPEGKTVLQSHVLQYDEDFLYWAGLSQMDYKKIKKELSAIVMDRVVAQFPALEGQIELLDCWTPLTYHTYCGAYHGAYMSFITRKGEKPFRVKGIIKGIDHLYIASQWISAPGGLPIAATSGKFAIQRILKKEGRRLSI